jgi:ATP-binding cassette, subfamily B, bacterial
MDSERPLAWPVARLADAIEELARVSGIARTSSARVRARSRRDSDADAIDGSVEQLSQRLQFESDARDVSYKEVERVLETAGPAVLRLSTDAGEGFLAVLASSRRSVRLLAPDGRHETMSIEVAARLLRRSLEQPLDDQVDRLLAEANVPERRKSAARDSLLRARLSELPATRCWLLRPAAAASFRVHMRHARLPRRLVTFVLAYVAVTLASAGAWWLIGAAALEGRFDPGTLLAWSFLLLSLVPLTVFAMWAQGVFAVGIGGLLKLRLLAGALKLDADDTRHEGIGSHFARVVESEAVEALALAGGFYAIAAVMDLILATAGLIATGRGLQVGLLVAFIVVLVVSAMYYFRVKGWWTKGRLQLTHDLVEKMVGHRTRLVQEVATTRQAEEDEALERYVDASKRMDRRAMWVAAIPRVWLFVGIAGLAPQFVSGGASATTLAVGVGATMLAFTALGKLAASVTTLSKAAVAWRQVKPLLDALATRDLRGYADTVVEPIGHDRTIKPGALVAAQDLTFRFRDRADAVLQGCSFRIASRDRIHLRGESGGGKSTLVSLLSGLRTADSGLLLLGGLDRATLGTKTWRRRIVAAPQFHENHLFNETLAFNLLMGRRWPPTAEDVEWADTVCRRLGLGDLLDRMPGGLFQVVGDTGWQLSHGERSRVYMARALLQGADLVVLDESFAELDPESLRRCLPEVANLANGLLVVAHA